MVLLAAASSSLVSFGCFAAEEVKFRRWLTVEETSCLRELFTDDVFHRCDKEISEFVAQAIVARPKLRANGQPAFVFVVHNTGWCGSAGCLLVIGERLQDGKCHLLGEGRGPIEHLAALDSPRLLDESKGETIIVLNQRDHGYRRLYTPCELRFDGHEYRQVRDECPNAKVWH